MAQGEKVRGVVDSGFFQAARRAVHRPAAPVPTENLLWQQKKTV